MSRHKPPTIADDVRRAARGRNVVLSSGSMDGALLQALANLRLSTIVEPGEVSTWADGVVTDKSESYIEQDGK